MHKGCRQINCVGLSWIQHSGSYSNISLFFFYYPEHQPNINNLKSDDLFESKSKGQQKLGIYCQIIISKGINNDNSHSTPLTFHQFIFVKSLSFPSDTLHTFLIEKQQHFTPKAGSVLLLLLMHCHREGWVVYYC